MSKSKDIRPKDSPNRDPQTAGFTYDEFFSNQLSLAPAIKEYLTKLDLDWRFINAGQFRQQGNTHRSHWQPQKFEGTDFGTALNVEGYITRGDLILATRKKQVSAAHRKFLKERNNLQKSHNKVEAQKMRQHIRDNGLGDQAKVFDGYEDNE